MLCVVLKSEAQAKNYAELKRWAYDPNLQNAVLYPDEPESFEVFDQLYADGNLFAGLRVSKSYRLGTGVGKDVAKANEILESLAAKGFGPALSDLGGMYLRGQEHLPADPKKGVSYLVRAIHWGHPSAMYHLAIAYLKGDVQSGSGKVYEAYKWASRAALQQVRAGKALKEAIEKKHGIPRPDRRGNVVVSKGLSIDPLGPNMGFTELFADVYYASPVINDEVIIAIKDNLLGTHPIYYYELARRMVQSDAKEAVFWFAVGGYRMRYHTQRCRDKTAGGVTQVMAMAMGSKEVGKAAMGFTESGEYYAIAKRAITYAANLPLETDPTWACRTGMSAMIDSLSGKRSGNALKPQNEWPMINENLKTLMLNTLEKKYAPKP